MSSYISCFLTEMFFTCVVTALLLLPICLRFNATRSSSLPSVQHIQFVVSDSYGWWTFLNCCPFFSQENHEVDRSEGLKFARKHSMLFIGKKVEKPLRECKEQLQTIMGRKLFFELMSYFCCNVIADVLPSLYSFCPLSRIWSFRSSFQCPFIGHSNNMAERGTA